MSSGSCAGTVGFGVVRRVVMLAWQAKREKAAVNLSMIELFHQKLEGSGRFQGRYARKGRGVRQQGLVELGEYPTAIANPGASDPGRSMIG